VGGPTRTPLLLDVDTGIDDALALLYAAASPEAELVAVTCLSGNAEAADTARNTLGVLELAGRTDVEVALGRPVPLVRELEITPETHGPRGIGYAELADPGRAVSRPVGPRIIV
jgi:purine nucleosidase